MERIPDNFSLSDIIRDPSIVRDALRFLGQIEKMEVMIAGGKIARIKRTPKSINAILDVSGSVSAASTFVPPPTTPSGICATGGTESQDGDYHVHVFNSNGNFVVTCPGNAEVLVVGGGAGGGIGGGGAGRWLKLAAHAFANGTHAVTIGAGGVGGDGVQFSDSSRGSNGGDTSIGTLKAIGGGAGGAFMPPTAGYNSGADGGSGGGSGVNVGGQGSGGLATDGTGTAGGLGFAGGDVPASLMYNGGGGGAGGVGGVANGLLTGGAGGLGLADAISGTLTYYAAGGGGSGNPGGAGGSNIGGQGASITAVTQATAAGANTGSGGGGGYGAALPGKAGGSGIVVIRYYAPDLSIAAQIGTQTFEPPAPEPDAATDCEACLNSVLIDDVTLQPLADDVTLTIMTNT